MWAFIEGPFKPFFVLVGVDACRVDARSLVPGLFPSPNLYFLPRANGYPAASGRERHLNPHQRYVSEIPPCLQDIGYRSFIEVLRGSARSVRIDFYYTEFLHYSLYKYKKPR